MSEKIKTLQCLVVDDEPLSLEVIEKYVADIPFLNIASTAGNAIEANQLLGEMDIDLIFLDINMPRLSGIQFLKSLPRKPLVIFTTAYPEYALEGFELDAVDYLLKPFSFNRFLKAANKARDMHGQLDAGGLSDPYLFIKSDKRLHKISQKDIHIVESAGDYIKIRGNMKSLVTHDTLKNFEGSLDPAEFIRVHKSYIINKNKIDFIEGNRIRVGEEFIPVGKAYKQTFFEKIGYL